MCKQEGWRRFAIGTILTFCVPPLSHEKEGQPIDSLFGVLDGEGYRIVYDYGPFSERLEEYGDRPGYSVSSRRVGARRARLAVFEDHEGDPSLPFTRLLRIEDGSNALTLRVSCSSAATCSLADIIFDSIQFK